MMKGFRLNNESCVSSVYIFRLPLFCSENSFFVFRFLASLKKDGRHEYNTQLQHKNGHGFHASHEMRVTRYKLQVSIK